MKIMGALISWVQKLFSGFVVMLSFIALVLLYSIKVFFDSLAHLHSKPTSPLSPLRFFAKPFVFLAKQFTEVYESIAVILDKVGPGKVSRAYLIELAFRNMQAKKTRTMVTIGGMSIGIAFIVFLVSVGYGLQHMVTSRVARLEELQQAEVMPGLSEELALTDQTLARLNDLPQVKSALPLISVVGRMSFQDSTSDLAVYGVTTEYLQSSAVQPTHGRFFQSHEVAYSVNSASSAVERASDESIPEAGLVRESQSGQSAETDEEVGLSENSAGDVLGEHTETSETSESSGTPQLPIRSNGTLPVINLATMSAEIVDDKRKVVPLPANSLREAVVNKAVLIILGMNEVEAIGKKITLTFVAVGGLVGDEIDRIESAPTEYTIVGVTPEEGTPVVFVPFIELRSLGIDRISQIKVVVNEQAELRNVRSTIEAMGYGTVSVVDTVAQINSLFSSFRIILAVIGVVALSVAALGMFNTLTVSLLERTREVGLMKAMGMKSAEVRELFLTESMIMGFYGGLFGLLIGFGAGKLLSLVLSSIAIRKGVGFLDISIIPLSFVLVIVILSLAVGLITGYYPAKRATRISALNALRYE